MERDRPYLLGRSWGGAYKIPCNYVNLSTLTFQILNYYEIIGFVTGVVSVYLNAKQNIWGWPLAMLNVSMYAIVFYNAKLYGDMALQVFFFILICYGLLIWLQKDNTNQNLKPTFCSALTRVYAIVFAAFMSGLFIGFLGQFTDSDMPIMDGITTAISVVAQILLARKKIENWLIWIFVDVLYVAMYMYKELYLTAFLYLIFIPIAYYGYKEWKNEMKNDCLTTEKIDQ